MKTLECKEGRLTYKAAKRLFSNTGKVVPVKCRIDGCEVEFKGVRREGKLSAELTNNNAWCPKLFVEALTEIEQK